MSTYKEHILLCEDDANLASVMAEYLRAEGFDVDLASDGAEGLEYLLSKNYDLCLTDVMMPQKDGIALLRELRESGKSTPVIITSERGSKEDIILGYEAGCDDYVVKPFSMDVVICKIRAILKRTQAGLESDECIFELGDTTFDSIRQTLGTHHLSTRENELMLMLCRKSNNLVERSQILKALWQADNFFSSRSLAVYINHLRKVMADVNGARILAVHGKGYKLVIDPKTEVK